MRRTACAFFFADSRRSRIRGRSFRDVTADIRWTANAELAAAQGRLSGASECRPSLRPALAAPSLLLSPAVSH